MSVPADVKKRISKLRDVINHHRFLYHVENKSEISEEALDSLKDELKKIENRYPELVTPDSPTQRVAGAPLPSFKKIKHKVSQWSFDDAFNQTDLGNFQKRAINYLGKKGESSNFQYFCELKIDGLKIILEYVDGLLLTAATRGDGNVGEDVTLNARTIESIPLRLKKNISGIFEGEVWLSKKNFNNLNKIQKKAGLDLYANPRNVAAGTMRQLDSKIVAERKLDCFVYDIAQMNHQPETQAKELELLKELGFKTNPHGKICKNLEEVWDFYKKLEKKKESFDYWVDGVVLKINELEVQETLGYTGKAPRYAIALKFPAEQKTSVVKDITLQIGRTGVITPVAELEPVGIAGTTVKRATLHNEDEINRLDVRIGDTVIVQKAGDIIPQVVEVLKDLRPAGTKPYKFPKYVKGCGGDGSIERVPGAAAYRCVSMDGAQLLSRRLEYFVSKKAFNIEGLGKKIIERFVELGYIKSPADIFRLHMLRDEIEALEGFKEKSVENLTREIEEARTVSLSRFLIALSIDEVGEETARLLASEFGSIDSVRKAKAAQLAEIHGIGEIMAEKIEQYFNNPEKTKEIDELLKEVFLEEESGNIKEGFFSGKVVVITGTFDNYSRDEIKEIVRMQGGKAVGSISKNTDYLLAGAKAGSKLEKAENLEIKIINEDRLIEILK